MYFRGAQAALVVFDITSRVSFEGAKRWVRDLQRSSEDGLVICLAGNKCDLAHLRQVEASEAEAYAAEAGLFYLETSARTAFNVEKAFLEVRGAACAAAHGGTPA
jgi:small GTP-binding protein